MPIRMLSKHPFPRFLNHRYAFPRRTHIFLQQSFRLIQIRIRRHFPRIKQFPNIPLPIRQQKAPRRRTIKHPLIHRTRHLNTRRI